MLDRLEPFCHEFIDPLFADACHEAVFCVNLEGFVVGLRDPRIVFLAQALDPGALLFRLVGKLACTSAHIMTLCANNIGGGLLQHMCSPLRCRQSHRGSRVCSHHHQQAYVDIRSKIASERLKQT